MIYEHTSYRTYLNNVLAQRVAKNPAYSLRAMAGQLGLAHSSLSDVIRGKKNLSSESVYRVASRLGLKEEEYEYFSLLVQLERTKDESLRETLIRQIRQIHPAPRPVDQVAVDLFRMISDWYHLPILEMTFLKRFRWTAREVARRLKISKSEVEVAIDRLVRLGLLKQEPNGAYTKTKSLTVTASKIPDQGLRRFHTQMLEKAKESLETQLPREKFVGSETLAIDPSMLPEFEKLIERFMNQLCTLAKRSENKTEVYHLGVQFFNLTGSGRARPVR